MWNWKLYSIYWENPLLFMEWDFNGYNFLDWIFVVDITIS